MLRTKVASYLKPRLLSGSVRCYTYRRAHGALTRELSEGDTEYERTRPSNGLRGGQRHCPGRACRVARSSLAGNSGRAKGVISEGYLFSMGVVQTRLCDHPHRRLRTWPEGGGGVTVACLKCGRLIEGAWRFRPGQTYEELTSENIIFRG